MYSEVCVEVEYAESMSAESEVVSIVCVVISKPPLSIVLVVSIVVVYVLPVEAFCPKVKTCEPVLVFTALEWMNVLSCRHDQKSSHELQHSSTETFA